MDKKSVITPRVIAQMLFFIAFIPCLPLLIARQWDWWEAWVYAISTILAFIISRVLAARRHPDLIAERARFMQHEDAQGWDKALTPWLGVGGALAMVVAGLDALLGWSPAFGSPIKAFSLLIFLAGHVLTSYALIKNRFFSGMVRLQTERGHQVVSSGPYGWVRHPGYAGGLLTYLATPFFLDSAWSILPILFTVVVLIVRTILEDRFLQAELPGYREYARQVRYRLLPGIW